jgi:CheY-like chemotaxis protein
MTNLIGNAIKFTEHGHVLVSIDGRVSNGIAHLHVSVKDTGIGIPEHKQSAVFREFEQVDGASNRKYEGTGLGLAITRKLLALMGSEIHLSSKESVGSEFFFTVGLPVDESGEVKKPTVNVDMDFSGRKILIVDDLPINREILSRQVTRWGMSVVTANSGAQAVKVALAEFGSGAPVDVAIFDFQMPGMDGHELCRSFKEHEELESIPMLLLSSVDQSTQKDRIRELGFAGCMLKPTRAEVLRQSVAMALSDESESDREGASTSEFDRQILTDAASVKRVLIVEDNEINQLVISGMLDDSKLEIEFANNGIEGAKAYGEFEPDMVFMDVSMPQMNGYDSTAKIRKYEKTMQMQRCPIIALTANAMQGDREKCLEAGMDDFMSKPVIMDELHAIVRKWLLRGEDPRKAA